MFIRKSLGSIGKIYMVIMQFIYDLLKNKITCSAGQTYSTNNCYSDKLLNNVYII